MVGPSRSGKSVAVIGGILQWDGPAVISSVKADLLATTRGWRATLGSVRVYDPTGTTIDPKLSARWSPVQHAHTTLGAQRAARALCDAGHHGGIDGSLDFWLAQAEILLSGLLYVAANSRRGMSTVCDWVLLQDRPTRDAPGDVQGEIDVLLDSDDWSIRVGAAAALKSLTAIWSLDDRARSAAYSTTQTLIWPWAEPTVAASSEEHARDALTDLDWLLGGANSLYLCSPIEDQSRLAPAIGGLLNDIISQAYRRVSATGQPLDPPLLVVIDEAGNMPLRSLPEYASTLAGIGVVLVTVWQSLAQLEARYGRQADTILTNHLTKCFFPGLSDPTSARYIDSVLGQTEVPSISRSTQARSTSASIQESTSVQPLAPPHALRQMRRGTALLIHGTLPPAHIRVPPFHQQPALRRRVRGTAATGQRLDGGTDRGQGSPGGPQ
jgi:type IV secretion system protein VirD4